MFFTSSRRRRLRRAPARWSGCVLAAALGGPVLLAPEARACDFFIEDKVFSTARVVPRDGASGVPTNTRIFVGGAQIFTESLGVLDERTALQGHTVELRSSGGAPIAGSIAWLRTEQWSGAAGAESFVVYTPGRQLDPGTSYTLLVDGRTITRFTTGAGPDTQAPQAPAVGIELTHRYVPDCDGASCPSPATFQLTGASEGDFLVARIRQPEARSPAGARLSFDPATATGVATGVGPAQGFTFGQFQNADRFVIDVFAIDSAGNVSAPTAISVDAHPRACIGGTPSCAAASGGAAGRLPGGIPLALAFAGLLAACARGSRRGARAPLTSLLAALCLTSSPSASSARSTPRASSPPSSASWANTCAAARASASSPCCSTSCPMARSPMRAWCPARRARRWIAASPPSSRSSPTRQTSCATMWGCRSG